MYSQALKFFPHIGMVLAAMVLFVGAFFAILVLAYFGGSRHNEAARLPLNEEE